jgi:hypothetical protein
VQILDRSGELVAHTLELPEVEQRRSTARDAGHAGRRDDVGKALGDDPRALALQARDLRAQ